MAILDIYQNPHISDAVPLTTQPTGQSLCVLNESRQYVQGVAWDPMGQYLATLSSDR